MKTTRYLFLSLLISLFGLSAEAQQRNVLQVPDVTMQIGNVQLPVNIENTDEIVGAQFDLRLPDGVTAEPVGTLTNRSDGHIVTVSQLNSGTYRVLLHSEANRPLLGQSGVTMYLPITIPDTFEEDSEYQLTISNAVLCKATGENVLTEAFAGKIHISKLPDLTVKNIIADKQTFGPGDHLVCSWQVENVGEQATGGGWSEHVSLVSIDGTQSKLIATTHYDDILNASGIVSRQTEVMLPFLLGFDGQVKLQVRIIPDSNTWESASAQGNNSQASATTFTLNKLLSIELSPFRIDENSNSHIALRVNRSGSWTSTQTFSITATADSRVSIPSSITIPANQSGGVLYFRLNDNDAFDDNSVVNITVSGNGYSEATTSLTINDNEIPTLFVTASKSEVTEGETFQLTITTNYVSANPITVTLTSENSRRFTFPASVIIPAGESSVTVDVTAIDNDEIELEKSIAFRASAEKYERGECIIILGDNDMPTLTFTLSPEAVSEAAGYAALFGVIKRTDNLDKRVTLKLSDDSNGLLTYTNQTIVMAKGQAEVQFNIGVTDNEIVDGNHVVNVKAAVYASSCNCSVSSDNKGLMTATVTIIDDDGPTLKIKPAGTAMLEGSEGNVFTISHNVQSDADIIVRISSDKDDMLEYNHELTIPTGQSTVNLLINVKSNEQQDDSNIATFKVEANGYAMGTCWVLITDQTLPDATISLTADKTEAEAEGTVLLRAVVKNVGNAPLRSTTPVEISFSGRTEKVKLTVGKTVAVGDSAVIDYNYDLPAITGNHTFEAAVNASGKVPELINANNTSEKVGIIILSPFSLTAQADKDIYQQGDSIYVSGVATGNAEKNAKVEVYFINEGARQTVSATTDEEGNYTVGWKPLSRQSGHFIVGACYPGAKWTEEMDAFDVYGIKVKDNYKTCELSRTDTKSGKIILTNPGNLAQTGLTVTPKAESENCVFTYDVPASIGAGESVEIVYTVTGNEISEGRNWQQMPLEITTAEGSHLDYTIYYYVHSLKARLQTKQSYINTTMTYGTPREYPVTIKNVGRAETGKITLALPNWIQAVTPNEMASLAQGDSATIVLRFIPTEAMKLNVRVTGRIGVNCANGDGTSISFNLTPVSDVKGKLKVDVVDEYTYFTAEAPHVSKAKVQVKDPSTNKVIAEGETADDGTFTAEIPEGYYSVTVDADKHDSYANTVIIDPGVEKNEEVFLSYQAITYSWEVEETSVEDEYEIETIVKYETRVPKPVVIITLPDEQPKPNSIIPVVVTNKGLVNALDFNLSLSVNDDYNLEFLNDQNLDVLAPQQSYVFYAKLVPASSDEAEARAVHRAGKVISCIYLIARGHYREPCDKNPGTETTIKEKRWGRCSGTIDFGGGSDPGGAGSYGPSYGPADWGNTYIDKYYIIDYLGDPEKKCFKPNDPNDPYNPNSPNDPINRDLAPTNEPPHINCNSDEEPIFVYNLVPVSGITYKMEGVAADGVSQVKLILNPKESRIPDDDCDKYSDYEWSVFRDWGKIEGKSFKEAIYTAPDSFPENRFSYYDVAEAVMSYTHHYNSSYSEVKHVYVKIKIIRPPVVFVHGLNDTETCWRSLDSLLIRRGIYRDSINYRVDYTTTNTHSFSTNISVIGIGIKKAQRRALCKGFVATKCDLVGHSMGGILSRLYVQNGGNYNTKEVNRIITVNTPHAGSEIADCIMEHNFFLSNLAQTFFTHQQHNKGFDTQGDLGAIRDLAVMSDAMINLNVDLKQKPDVPVYSIATELDYSSRLLQSMGNEAGLALSAASLTASLFTCPWYIPLVIAAATYGDHIVNNDLSQVGIGDFVVSTESQIGGCESYKTIGESGTAWDINQAINFVGLNGLSGLMPINPSTHITGNVCSVLYSFLNEPWHCKSPSHYDVMNELSGLLSKNAKDSIFSRLWFKPESRTFNHNFMWVVNVASSFIPSDFQNHLREMNFTKPLKLSKDAGDILKVGLDGLNLGLGIQGLLRSGWDYVRGITNNSARRMASSQMSSNEDRFVRLELNVPEGYSNPLVTVAFGDDIILTGMGDNIEFKVPSTFFGDAEITIFMKNEDDKIVYEEYLYTIESPFAAPVSLTLEEATLSVDDSEPLRLYCTWSDGSTTKVLPDKISFDRNDIITYVDQLVVGLKPGMTYATVNYRGLTCDGLIRVFASKENETEDDYSNSICSTVTLSFKQKAVMTRQAFRGTLTVNNGNETTAMKDVKINLEVRDMDGNLTTSHEFQIDAESLNGFKGDLDFTSGWSLGGGETGVATILFIPTKYAAPTEPKDYSFGGSFSYTDPYTGLTVTRDLNPVTLTVKPSPNLEMTYFMQRDVFGDDPLTETVEPMIPSEFALVVNNKGYGDAENMSLTTHQPEIIDNQKGLAINFELISTQLNGGDKNLSLGGSMTSDFGAIPAHSQAYAQWWLQSSLLGHFIEYDVKATHITSRNNPDLSLLDTVTVHELIHGFMLRTEGDKPLRGFLVNDIKDKDDQPDNVYFTDATQQAVYIASNANIVKESDTEYVLNVKASNAGWNYGSLLDPTYGKQKLVKVTRADGTEVNADNIWQTDRTLRDGKDPIYENRLHFVGNMTAEGETFYLTFEPKPDVELEVASIVGIPEDGSIATAPVDEITVNFTKTINPETFTAEDLTLTIQGIKQDISNIDISSEDNKSFKLNLSVLSSQFDNGYYALTVQTADIIDNEGFQGRTGKQVGWIMFRDGLVQLITSTWPVNSGSVTRKPNEGTGARSLAPVNENEHSAQYGSSVTLVAEPATGYEFTNWTLNGEAVSTDIEFTTTALSDMNVVANFTKKKYMVNVNVEGTGGTTDGTATGIYDFGTEVNLTAVPDDDYVLKGWTVNGKAVEGTDPKLTMTVDKALDIDAMFMQEYYRQSITLARGWNWISAYLREPLSIAELSQYANRIMSQTDELINDPEFGLVGSISELTAGQAYKIEANSRFTNTFRGHLYNISATPINLHKGWNWVAFPFMDIAPISAMTTAEEGDFITSQKGFAEYADGFWAGTLDTFTPGDGYLYKSASDKCLGFDATISVNGSRTWMSEMTTKTKHEIDIYRYPNTMNVTARIYRDGTELVSDGYVIYAMVGDEVRGISQYVSGNHYITVYGDEPVDVSFLVEYAETGETYVANEVLKFCSDVVGSRKSPYAINISGATGIESFDSSRTMTIYTIEGVLVSRDATLKTLRRLPKGVYIVNGQKYLVK